MINVKVEKQDITYKIIVSKEDSIIENIDLDPLTDYNIVLKDVSEKLLDKVFDNVISQDEYEEAVDKLNNILVKILPIKLGGDTDYLLLAPDGFKVNHTGFFLKYEDKYVVSEIFYAYSHVKKMRYNKKGEAEEVEYNIVAPYLLIYKYTVDGLLRFIKPIENDELDLGDKIIRLKRKSLAENSLPTQLDLNTVKLLYRLSQENLKNIGDVKNIYVEILSILRKHVWFQDDIYYILTALWIIGTYFSDIFHVYPILHIYGSSGSGKTRLTSLATALSRRGYMLADPKDTNIYRVIEGYRPVIGIDDFDIIVRRYKKYLVSLLKHVYKDSVLIPRLEKTRGDRFILGLFSMYAPTIVNSVDRLESGVDESLATQIQTRYIEIEMVKSRRSFKSVNFEEEYSGLRSKLYITRFLYANQIYESYYSIDTGLYGRHDELWKPILTIAKLIDEELYEKVRAYAYEYSMEKEAELYQEEKLIIRVVENLFTQKNLEGLPVDIVEFTASDLLGYIKLILTDEERLTEKQFEKEWSVQRLGRILERMHIPKKRKGVKGTRVRTVSKELLKELKLRYEYDTDNTDNTDNNISVSSEKQNENIQSFTRKEPKSSSEKTPDTHNILSVLSEMSEENRGDSNA